MQRQILLFAFSFIIYCNHFTNTNPLVGPLIRRARRNEFTYVVCIVGLNTAYTTAENVKCTGAILSRIHVVTSEHCFSHEHEPPFRILAGHRELERAISYFPLWRISYDQWAVPRNITLTRENDITIIRTIQEFPQELGVAVIPSHLFLRNVTRTIAFIPGWGISNNGQIAPKMEVGNVTIISMIECTARIARLCGFWIVMPMDMYYCTRADPFVLLRDGDSGGPLLIGNNIVALNKATVPRIEQSIHPEKVNVHVRIDLYFIYLASVMNEP